MAGDQGTWRSTYIVTGVASGAMAGWPLRVIQAGAGLFIVALVLSTLIQPAVWLLHTLQALIYVAIVVLSSRNSAWGFGAGFAVAVAWNAANLFVTSFIPGGVEALAAWLRTGHLTSPALLLVVVGAAGHFLMIAGCLAGFFRRHPKLRQWGEFLGGAILLFLALALISPLRTHALPLPLDVGSLHTLGGREPSTVAFRSPPRGWPQR